MSLSSIPPKFTAIRKRYNIDIKVVNSGALQRNRPNSPKKRQSANAAKVVRSAVNPQAQPNDPSSIAVPMDFSPQLDFGHLQQHP